jgi:hypothetical protein
MRLISLAWPPRAPARLVEGEMKWGLGFIGAEARADFVVPKSVCGRWIWMDDQR